MSIKSMRRLIAAGLCVLMCAASFLTAFADGEPITISECDNLQITLPDNMSAVTRSTESGDRYFSRHNLTYQEVQDMFSRTNIYLQAMDNDNVITLTLSYSDTDSNDFNAFSNAELAEVARNFIRESGSDVTYKSSTQDEAGKEIVWLYFEISVRDTVNNTEKKQYQATTVNNGKNVTLTIFRNAGDAEASDYQTLESISKTVKFPAKEKSSDKKMMMFIVIGAGTVAVIILLIIIIVTVKKSKRRKAKNRNDKILEELADKYQSRPVKGQKSVKRENTVPAEDYSEKTEYEEPAEYKPTRTESKHSYSDSYKDSYEDSYDDEPKRKYSDEDIARLLGDLEDDENFIDTLPATEADSDDNAEVRDSVIEKADAISEFFEDAENEENAAVTAAEQPVASAYTELREEAPAETEEINSDPAEEEPENGEVSDDRQGETNIEINADEQEETPDETDTSDEQEEAPDETDTSDEQVEVPDETDTSDEQQEFPEEAEVTEQEKVPEDIDIDDEQTETPGDSDADEGDDGESDDETDSDTDEDDSESSDSIDEEFEEFVNDEVLARNESKQERFKSSNDFFEEAPRRIFGVISSKQIEEAEEYDVIGEVEQQAEKIEQEPPKAKERKSIGASFKNFATHCGYFATNVKREIKRRRARKKRKKAEEERRRLQIERRQQERAVKERRRDSNGLVQVRSRDDRPRKPKQ